MALLPQHLTPWNDSATTQGSETAMPPFLLRIKALQQEFAHFLNSTIIAELRKIEPNLASDATYVFDEPMLMRQDEYVRMFNDLTNSGIITKEQSQKYLIKIGVLDETILNSEIHEADIDGKIDDKKDDILNKNNQDEEALRSYEEFKKTNKVTVEKL
jgi:hypothetical protein